MPSYFVAYAHARGFGHSRVELADPITDMDGIKIAMAAIQRDQPDLGAITVINWQRFEDEPAMAVT